MAVTTRPRPFRFGLFGESIRSASDLRSTALTAEQLGYSILLIRDHWLEEPFGNQLAPIAALATAAALTRTLRVGSMVFANDYRNPVLLAKEAATIDVLSGGRFELGLGAGFLAAEYESAGLDFEAPGRRVDRFEEAIRLYRSLLAGESVHHRGRHYRVDLDPFPRPARRPPVMVGAAGRRMLSIAGREADIVGLLAVSTADGVIADNPEQRLVTHVEEQLGWVREAAGDRFDQIELSITATLVIDADRESAAGRLARQRGWEVDPATVLDMPSVFIGRIEDIAAQMRDRRARLGLSYYVVSDRSLHTAAPLVELLSGT
jgi:probable F420-dependent oxidoreductase